jgi:hypothetical protein
MVIFNENLLIFYSAIFFPYLEQSFGIVLEMVDYPTPGVKKSAIVAVGNMCTCVHQANTESTSVETTTGKN